MSYINKQALILDCTRRLSLASDYKSMYEALRDAIDSAPEIYDTQEDRVHVQDPAVRTQQYPD